MKAWCTELLEFCIELWDGAPCLRLTGKKATCVFLLARRTMVAILPANLNAVGMKKMCRSSGLVLALMSVLSTGGLAQDVRNLPPVSRSYAITKVTVIPSPGRKLEQATVVLRDGIITAVGTDVVIPSDAAVIRGDSLFVYAGFIDGLSRAGVSKPREESPKERPKDPGNPAPEAAGITPYVDVRSVLNPFDKAVEELRALGFTAGQVVPYGGMLPGRAAVVYYNGEPIDRMVLNSFGALYSELTPAERVYPATLLGVMAKWKELYRQASEARAFSGVYANQKRGLEAPASDRVLEAFYPVIARQVPVAFKAEKSLDVQRVVAMREQLGFDLILADVKEGWDVIPALKSTGRVFLSVDLPEEKKEEKGKDIADRKKNEQAMFPDSLERKRVEKRRDEFIALYVGQAAALQKASVPFGFSTLSAKPRDIKPNIARMIKAGLSEDAALGALTIQAAQALGLGDRLGTIEQGKVANLVISRKPYFDVKSQVKYVFIAGKLFEIKPSGSDQSEADKKKEKP